MKIISLVTMIVIFIAGNSLPLWGETCTKTGVYGDPYGLHDAFYTLPVGTRVRIRETSRDGTWVMIKPAKWIPLSTLCEWKIGDYYPNPHTNEPRYY